MSVASISDDPCSESGSRPGLTSLVKTGRGLMTVQTEIVGDPARLVTIVDFRGRVLKRWQSPFLVELADLDAARRWHQAIDKEVRDSLARLAKRVGDRSATVGACLFVEALRAYASREFETARMLLDASEGLVPGDNRIGFTRARLYRAGSH